MVWVLILGFLLGGLFDLLTFKRYNELERARLRRENQRLKWIGFAKDAEINELNTKARTRNITPIARSEVWDVPTQPTWPPREETA